MFNEKTQFEISKTDSIIVYSIFGIPMVIFVYVVLFNLFFDPKSHRDYFLEDRSKIKFIGVVDSVFRQKQNHNILNLKSNSDFFEVDGEWEAKFKLGDSLHKETGSFLVKYYRDFRL